MKRKKHIKFLKDIILMFLQTNGGVISNGFATTIDARLSKGVHNSLQWHTPKCNDLTGSEVSRIGRDFAQVIKDYLLVNDLPDLQIESTCGEHGQYDIHMYFVEKTRIL